MKKVMHFKSTKERLDYLKGNFKEIIPKKVKKKPSKKKGVKKDEVSAE